MLGCPAHARLVAVVIRAVVFEQRMPCWAMGENETKRNDDEGKEEPSRVSRRFAFSRREVPPMAVTFDTLTAVEIISRVSDTTSQLRR